MLSQENSKKLEPQLPGVGATCGKRLSRSQISAPDWLDREIEVGEGRKRKERRREENKNKYSAATACPPISYPMDNQRALDD